MWIKYVTKGDDNFFSVRHWKHFKPQLYYFLEKSDHKLFAVVSYRSIEQTVKRIGDMTFIIHQAGINRCD